MTDRTTGRPSDNAHDVALAGEYALGLLEGSRQRQAALRLATDPEFADLVGWWRTQLDGLARTPAVEAAPEDLLLRIDATLDARADAGTPAEASRLTSDRGHVAAALAWWRRLAAGFGLVAAGAVAALLVILLRPVADDQATAIDRFALLSGADGQPAFLVEAVADSAPVVRPIGRPVAPEDAVFEIWLIEPEQAPRSLGVLPVGAAYSLPEEVNESVGSTLAISLEPPGGSPTGAPTGPVVSTAVFTQP
ncbi:MAG: anti-sigma factor [Azospirillaceae bacterium]